MRCDWFCADGSHLGYLVKRLSVEPSEYKTPIEGPEDFVETEYGLLIPLGTRWVRIKNMVGGFALLPIGESEAVLLEASKRSVSAWDCDTKALYDRMTHVAVVNRGSSSGDYNAPHPLTITIIQYYTYN